MNPAEAWLTVAYNMHGNEPLGAAVARELDGHPGIIPVDLHPAAAAVGMRMLGAVGEFGSQLPGDNTSDDPEARAAADAKCQLEWAERLHNGQPFGSIIADLHCTTMPDAQYASVGELVWPETLALAKKLGRTTVQWLPDYPFFGYFPNAVSIDATVRDERELAYNTHLLARQLREVAGLGMAGLTAYFHETGIEDMTFYRRFADVMLIVDGRPNTAVLHVLDELEAIEAPRRYTPVYISERVAQAVGIKPGRYITNTWGHRNMSRPFVGLPPTATGDPRRECFGDLLIEVKPPVRLGRELLYFGLQQTRL